jgi:hypothetical protein
MLTKQPLESVESALKWIIQYHAKEVISVDLTNTNIVQNKSEYKVFDELVSKCPKLERLSVAGVTVRSTQSLPSNQNFQLPTGKLIGDTTDNNWILINHHLDLKTSSSFPQLKALNISGYTAPNIDDIMKAICTACPNLETLICAGCTGLGDRTCFYICHNFAGKISLYCCKFWIVTHFIPAAETAEQAMSSRLSSLRGRGPPARQYGRMPMPPIRLPPGLGAVPQQPPQMLMHTLQLNQPDIIAATPNQPDIFAAIPAELTLNKVLKVLDISNTAVTTSGVQFILKACPSLCTLVAVGCKAAQTKTITPPKGTVSC